MAKAWAVRLFSPEFIGIVYFDTRREARAFLSLVRPSGLRGWAGRTGL